MAGDWIKMRTNLDTDPRVFEIAAETGLPELHVVGLLWKCWAWADTHTLDGNAVRVTCVTIDRITGTAGFALALRNVGWLEGRDNALTFPRFAEHNGQTAKTRANTADRVRKHRNAKPVTDVTPGPLPEKSREEKKKKPPNAPREALKAEGFEDEWCRWVAFRTSVDGQYSPIRVDADLMELFRRDQAAGGIGQKAASDINFSIRKGAKSLCDSDHDYESQRANSRSGAHNGKKSRLNL